MKIKEVKLRVYDNAGSVDSVTYILFNEVETEKINANKS